MKRKIGPIVTILVGTFLSLAAQQVNTSYNHDYDFSKAKTFAVKVMPPWSDTTLEDYVVGVVATDLRAKGWIQAADESSADLLVVIQGNVETKTWEEAYYDGGMMGISGVSSPPGVTSARTITQKLAEGRINVFDTRTNELVYSGVGTAEVSSKEKKNEHKIKKGIERVLKHFPSKAAA